MYASTALPLRHMCTTSPLLVFISNPGVSLYLHASVLCRPFAGLDPCILAGHACIVHCHVADVESLDHASHLAACFLALCHSFHSAFSLRADRHCFGVFTCCSSCSVYPAWDFSRSGLSFNACLRACTRVFVREHTHSQWARPNPRHAAGSGVTSCRLPGAVMCKPGP